jgi:uncharacterized protein (DUF488 family)
MTRQLHTLGYAAPDAEQQLATLMADPSILLVDIRYNPRSRWRPQWNKKALQAAWGDRYRHVQALGNVNYRLPDAPIQLLDADAGIQWAGETLQAGYSLILLCACRDYERCHRKTVKELIEAALGEKAQE